MKIVYDNGEANINRIPMVYACCDKCENPNRFAIGFINEPLVNTWDEEEHKYCEKCGAFMDWETVNIEIQYKIFLAEHDRQIRADIIDELYTKIDEGVCDICEYQNFDGGCFKTCTFEMENAKRWLLSLKEQNK